ncbi:MAG: hypothetical protein JO362_06115 [Streptomycetaceae bacterium]|nr:hypothetical protein [Streptomycetaceae bacterium]
MTPDIRALLAAVIEAIDIPSPAAVGDREEYARLLEDRALDAVVALKGVLGEPLAGNCSAHWHTAYLHRQLAKKPPTGYRHYDAPDGGGQA